MPKYSLVERIRRWWLGRILKRSRVPESVWQRIVRDVPLIARLSAAERHRLRELTTLFLRKKVLVAEGGFELDEYRRALIAAQACVLILNLGLEYYQGWVEVIVYPEAFVATHQYMDGAGVMHQSSHALSGESWSRGPVIFSWQDIETHHHQGHGLNVVLHEFAHKLDTLDGSANGAPPLHRSMQPGQWSEAFSSAYNSMLHQVEAGNVGRIDPYAVESPAEFFAVVTEFFFERPRLLKSELPDVYIQLSRFYRQDPLQHQ